MNNDLISREALIKAICEKGIKGYEEYNQGLAAALDLIDLAPTVDIKDEIAGVYNEGYMCGNKEAEKARPQGEWLKDEEHSITIEMFKCSICGFWGGANHFNFCPRCGAKMKVGEDNG